MAKAKNKTTENDGSVLDFLNQVEDQQRKKDALTMLELMSEITSESPKMWGTSIVGFGSYHYKYESGREGDFMKVGFSPRKTSLTLYIMPGFERYAELMEKLGKFKTGKSCLYVKKLEDVNGDVLRALITAAYQHMTNKYS